jgi:hypothetical protein
MKIDNALNKTGGRFATIETSHRGTFSAKLVPDSITAQYVTLNVPSKNLTMKVSKDKITKIRCGKTRYTKR